MKKTYEAKDAFKVFPCLFSNAILENDGLFDSWEYFFEHCNENSDTIPTKVFGMKVGSLHMDAQKVLDFYFDSDAFDSLDVEDLQFLLDGWCNSVGGSYLEVDEDSVVLVPTREQIGE